MYYTHSKESATITFKKNGRYIKSGLRKANRFLRDWRRKEPTRMDPALLDLVWEVYQKTGATKPIMVISGYRSPKTNNMLRRRGRKVARNSQHTRGKALDFFIPGVSVQKLRALGLKAHRGGVGYYRGSFVHLDTGRVRHWPRMSSRQLKRVFPKGRTIHVPSNGRPLRGYKVALANLKKGLNADGTRRGSTVRKSLLARLFQGSGNDGDEDEGAEDAVVAKKAEKKPEKKKAPAKKKEKPKKSGPDPFATELTALAKKQAVDKAKADAAKKKDVEQKLKEAEIAKLEEARKEQNQLAALDPFRIAKPKARPVLNTQVAQNTSQADDTKQVDPALTQLALAPATGPASGPSSLAPVGATELALARPSQGVGDLIRRPPADIPSAKPSARPATELALRPSTTSLPVPAAPSVQAEPLVTATVGKEKQQPSNGVVSESKLASLRSRITEAFARPAKPTAPSLREEFRVPIPKLAPQRKAKEVLQASLGDVSGLRDVTARPTLRNQQVSQNNALSVPGPKGNAGALRGELALGDLDGNTVTAWAVASSTRVGPVASLRAPNYKVGVRRAAPASVYSAGFGFRRSPLRADRFTGRALTRVAFAHFSVRN